MFFFSQTYLAQFVTLQTETNVGEKSKHIVQGAQLCIAFQADLCEGVIFSFLLKLINFSVESSRPQEDDSE